MLKQHMPETNSSDCLNLLTGALIEETYANENEFDVALFDALKNGLGSSVTVENITTKRKVNGETEEKNRNIIVVNSLRWTEKDSKDWLHECAIAFATQVTNNGDLQIPEEFGCATSSRHDHSCVLIARRNKKKDGTGDYFSWKVRENLATVELKRQKESILLVKKKIKRKRDRADGFYQVERINTPIGQKGFGALWQIIAYTISDVWTCLARTGAETQRSDGRDGGSLTYSPPTCIPFALLACVITGEKANEQASRYAYGNIVIPEVCGDSFSFNLLSDGTFEEDTSGESVTAAAAAYIKVLSFGVSMGSSIKGRALSIGKHFYSMSGRKLHLSGHDITSSFELLRSPISTDKFGAAASQGEIWRGRPDSSFHLGDVEDFLKFADIDFANSNSSLLLKCSSKMIHNPLVGSSKSWRALKRIVQKGHQEILNTVLIYAEYRNEEVTMLMHDLSNTHKDLLPFKHSRDQFPKLWCLFCDLVRKTLLGLARIGIVHPDVRPGYDFTSNILLRLPADEEDKRVEQEQEQVQDDSEMVLIDLDSLTCFEDWPVLDSPGYLNKEDLNPYSYVWWQCLAVAMMWKRETPQSEGFAALRDKFVLSFETTNCTAAEVETLLTKVSESDWFDDQELTDERVTTILDYALYPVEEAT